MPSETKNGLTFSESVGPEETEELSYTVPADATVESIKVRIYPGPELDLTLTIHRIDNASGERISMLRTVGKDVIDGDNDVWEWDVSIPVPARDDIVVEASNADDTETYDFRVNMDLDELGGVRRIARRLFG